MKSILISAVFTFAVIKLNNLKVQKIGDFTYLFPEQSIAQSGTTLEGESQSEYPWGEFRTRMAKENGLSFVAGEVVLHNMEEGFDLEKEMKLPIAQMMRAKFSSNERVKFKFYSKGKKFTFLMVAGEKESIQQNVVKTFLSSGSLG